MPPSSGARLGPYQLGPAIGAGGMGEVYRARDPRLGRDVAIKILPPEVADDPERLQRFEQEARAAASLSHPNILAVHDVGSDAGVAYLVTELLEGQTLREFIDATAGLGSGRADSVKALGLAAQIADGLAAAHNRGLVHRDLKPENVFVTRDGRAKILDFGLAKRVGPTSPAAEPASETGQSPVQTVSGVILGTVGYMAPEQVRGQAVDARTDIFAFGCVLYELVTGQRAFRGDTPMDTLSAILHRAPDPIPTAPAGAARPPLLARIIERCLEKAPADRFQSAADLAFGLRQAVGVAAAPSHAQHAARGAWWPVAALLAVLLIGGAGWMIRGAMTSAPAWPEFKALTFREGAIQSARFLSDGRTVVYAAAWDGGPFRTYSVRVERPESEPLDMPPAGVLAASSRDELAVVQGCEYIPVSAECVGALAVAPIGAGAARVRLERVNSADFAPDGLGLAVIAGAQGSTRKRIEYPIGTVLVDDAGDARHVRVSPSGKQVAFLSTAGAGISNNTIVVSDGGPPRVLATGLPRTSGLAWSPGGSELWLSDREKISAVNLAGERRVIYRDSGNVRLTDVSSDGRALIIRTTPRVEAYVARGGGPIRPFTWLGFTSVDALSGDGRWLLFSERGESRLSASYDLFIRDTDGAPPLRLGEGRGLAVSADGKFVLANRSVEGGPTEILVVPTGAGTARVLANDLALTNTAADFLPDGSAVLFAARRGGTEPRTWKAVLTGSHDLRALDHEPGEMMSPLSPDGNTFISQRSDGTCWRTFVDGRPSTPLPLRLAAGEFIPQWASADAVYLSSLDEDRNKHIWTVALNTGMRTKWRVINRVTPAGSLRGFNRVHLSYGGGTIAFGEHRQLSQLFMVTGLK